MAGVRALTPKERGAAMHFVEHGVKSDAFRAFYSHNFSNQVISQKAYELFERPKVKAFVDELLAEHKERHNVNVDRIINEYEKLAFSDIRKLFDADGKLLAVHELPDDIAGAVSSVKVNPVKNAEGEIEYVAEFRLSDKRASLQDLGKHFKMFSEDINLKAEVTVEDVSDLEIARRLAFILAKGANAAT